MNRQNIDFPVMGTPEGPRALFCCEWNRSAFHPTTRQRVGPERAFSITSRSALRPAGWYFKFRRRGRLEPLPYVLDEDDS